MLLRLWQLTAHPFVIQETIEDLFETEDVENIWQTTVSEVTADDSPTRDMLKVMWEMIAENDMPAEPKSTTKAASQDVQLQESQSNEPALIFEFHTFFSLWRIALNG